VPRAHADREGRALTGASPAENEKIKNFTRTWELFTRARRLIPDGWRETCKNIVNFTPMRPAVTQNAV